MGYPTERASFIAAHNSFENLPFKAALRWRYYFIVCWSCREHVLALDMHVRVMQPSGTVRTADIASGNSETQHLGVKHNVLLIINCI